MLTPPSYLGPALCLITLTLPVWASPVQDAKKAIQTAYADMDEATGHRNVAAYSVYLAPDFAGIDEKGTNTGGKAETLQALSRAFAQVSAAKSTTQVLTLVLQDGGAVVTTRSGLTLTGKKNSRPFVIKSENQARDFWTKSSGRWHLKRERVLSMTQTVQGLPVPQGR